MLFQAGQWDLVTLPLLVLLLASWLSLLFLFVVCDSPRLSQGTVTREPSLDLGFPCSTLLPTCHPSRATPHEQARQTKEEETNRQGHGTPPDGTDHRGGRR